MADQWEFYPCQMGDHTAFVFVNVSIGDRLTELARTGQVLIRVQLKHPRDDGLTTTEEFDALSQLEDGFTNYCETASADMVGRITVGGFRDFAVYAEDAQTVSHGLRTIAEDEHGYEVEYLVRDDPEFEVYWKHLYPTPVDWQLIQNRQLVEQLEEQGDDCESSRRIDHWVHFDSAKHRDQFEKRVLSEGFAVEDLLEAGDEDLRHGLHIYRDDTPDFAQINDVTMMLFRLAEEFGGEYDGWETQVTKAE
jgi:regulator of RNase E activity RraB